MKRIIAAIATAGLTLGSAAGAQDTPEEAANETIVVSGQTPREAAQFASRISLDDPYSPLALYEPDEFCPGVVGLTPALNSAIAARMRLVAADVGMEPAKTPCQTSALVIFADDREALLKRFRKLHPEYFRELTGEEIVYTGRREPVMAWQLIARVDRNNVPVPVDSNGIQIVQVTNGMSRLVSASRPIVAMSVLLIERSAVRGLTAQQIGDYALMRSVTDRLPRDLKTGPLQTILSVIDVPEGDPTPLSLTRWDHAYVASRYAVNRWNRGTSQMAKIRGALKRTVTDSKD